MICPLADAILKRGCAKRKASIFIKLADKMQSSAKCWQVRSADALTVIRFCMSRGCFENEPVSISKIMTSQRYSLVTYAAYDVYCTNHDWNTLDKILELDAYGYYMMNILDYLVGNTDRHWENWGLLVDNETNKTVRLHDLMDFNRAFQQYDILDGASCLTVGKRHLSQREAAMEALRKIGLNQFVDVAVDIFPKYKNWLIKFQVRLHALKANESFR